MNATAVLIIGGARSGKSRFALTLAEAHAECEKLFLATCVPKDPEMEDRVLRHRKERGSHWKTLEIPLALAEAITAHGKEGRLILVDCLTLWVNNVLFQTENPEKIEQDVAALVNAVDAAPCPILFVSNEVGTGIVPENRLARLFRDAAGRVNQQVAAACTRVFWMVAGIPVPVKSPDL